MQLHGNVYAIQVQMLVNTVMGPLAEGKLAVQVRFLPEGLHCSDTRIP